MTLVGKPSGRSNCCQRSIGNAELTAGMFDAKLTNVLSNGTAVELPEFTRQMNGMYAHRCCQVSNSEVLGELFMEKVKRLREPARRLAI